MKKLNLIWVFGIGVLTLGVVANTVAAPADGEVNAAVNGVADLLAKGDTAGATKAAKAAAKNDVEAVMHVFKLRKKKGIGLGTKADTITPDGIEAKLDMIARDGISPANLKKEGEALTRAGYVMAAVGHIALAAAPAKNEGKKMVADWVEWSKGMIKASDDFSTNAKAMSAAELKKSAAKIKLNCDNCHAVFK